MVSGVTSIADFRLVNADWGGLWLNPGLLWENTWITPGDNSLQVHGMFTEASLQVHGR
jgi:hypothetical protein